MEKIVLRLESEFKRLIHKADEIRVAVAMLTDYGLSLFDNRDENCDFQILVGYDLPTQPSALQKLIDRKIETKIYDLKKQFFHPKVYLFRINETWTAFVGSGNCTKGGVNSNIELSYKIEDQEAINELLDWYKTYYNLGTILNQNWLDDYRLFYKERSDKEEELKIITNQFKKTTGVLKGKINFSDYNFDNQFFGYKHYNAFTPPKPTSDKKESIDERSAVCNKLKELHEGLYPLIQKTDWNVYPHHKPEHITSSYKHHQWASEDLNAIWLHYGRSEEELKQLKDAYGENMTSLHHMRLQVMVVNEGLWIELRVGKKDGSYLDREHIRKQLKTDKEFVDQYYRLINTLDDASTIIVADDEVPVKDFKDEHQLKEFTLNDKPKFYYFRIGRLYKPDDKYISERNIVTTVINDFEKLFPLYQLFKYTL